VLGNASTTTRVASHHGTRAMEGHEMSDTMRALAMTSFDEPPAVIEVPVPTPAPGEVSVRVGAASVNAYDTFVAMGAMKDYLPYEFPAVLGMDVAGRWRA
jgi:D-arabinose 1-dehydrogenase-like Zn-dependent alcohol dehydrogenase